MSSHALHNQLFNLKFTSKSLVRASKKCEKAEKAQKKKLKQAIEKGNMEGARIYAANAIREKNQALSYLQLASRIDAVAARVETAVRMNSLTRSMTSVVKGMDKVLATMQADKIAGVLEKFEKQFDDLDVRSGYMESAMASSTAMSTPQDQVDTLISQVADEHGLEVAGAVEAAPTGAVATRAEAKTSVEDDLAARLEALRK
mmetsp:Transcript_7581/g.23905  ORF Transcript_7581/g.23905 Transcript_7581/m.23905 type:complete len:202 (-) Transcript_7581:59-664(-)|eukprot:CAMPEP_0196780284 /NCGR_PEP_ID=MMETSP1104-20130614/7445_1 /TAXON_ID=33652 /ORGANISM="Cafeteria sp., Strain Caron Lab Isolate" /LENGTH=201 /DNA_ID=CAMNT_0042150481 /DNA_START=42 /DNA_END=647 /DNA_ORIENTATION=+